MTKLDFLSELEKWQACSHPRLANCQAEELFHTDFVQRYRRLHRDLWSRITRVQGTLYTIEQLHDYPIDYHYALEAMQFWRLVFQNFLEIAIVMLHGLVNDTGSDVHSLNSFRSEIIKAPWLHDENRDLLTQTLRERKFDAMVESIATRVDRIRDNHLAHRLVDKQTGSPKEALVGVSLEELRQLFDAAHSLFGALSFGSAYVTLAGDLMPASVAGKPVRTCLEGVLDAVLRDSHFVNWPERRAQWWPEDRKFIPRKRCG